MVLPLADRHSRGLAGVSVVKETELAAKVVEWLSWQHWEVYQEVQFNSGGPIADIVALRQGIMWVIECKTSLGFAVLEQAARWPVHYRSVATPTYPPFQRYKVIEEFYKAGVITVSESGVSQASSAPLQRQFHRSVVLYRARLNENQKHFAKAGSKSGAHWTPYKETMRKARDFIERNPGCTVGDIYEQLGKSHYSSRESFKGNIGKALREFEKEWCEVDTNSRPYRFYIRS